MFSIVFVLFDVNYAKFYEKVLNFVAIKTISIST